ncbi:thrombospondin type 3 repeat-containing protein [Polyangium aurulentum]|uniref:thrombospondin type 3 repeat-containing protein n=1 Tax=Polyangium aurulentum TaxID=2567896 RepID=UPI0010AE9285|nr:thrombospondin type 3 repeat-containing protein [Polyangium aurulentum]UQA57846.1 thrombospondin type 3 repeat-containing protein [Polyangium aurulentum]
MTGLLFLPSTAAARNFPQDAQWTPLTQMGVAVTDPDNDAQIEANVVGYVEKIDTYAAAYVHSDDAFLYFRLRVDETVMHLGSYKATSWVCLIDTDASLNSYEFAAGVHGNILASDVVELRQNTMPTVNGNPKDKAETVVATYPVSTHAREAPATSMANMNPDFFIDWAVAKVDLAAAGVTDQTPLRIICGTSNDASSLAGDLISDIGDTTLDKLGTDPVLCGPTGCFVPCAGFGEACTVGQGVCQVASTNICDANGNAMCDALPGEPMEETCNGIDDNCDGMVDEPCMDKDGDGLSDAQETMYGSHPEDSDSDDDGVSDPEEIDPGGDADKDGKPNIADEDSDNDGLFDGTELGKDCSAEGTDPAADKCIPDADPTTTTEPLNPDTDGGGEADGNEDGNHDGALNAGERDPNFATDDILPPEPPADRDNDGIEDEADPCPDVPDPDLTPADTDHDALGDACDGDIDGDGLENFADPCPLDPRLSCPNPEIDVTGCACHAAGHADARGFGALLMATLLLAVRRRRGRSPRSATRQGSDLETP